MSGRHDLGSRREAVFDAFLDDRSDDLHPDDRDEAAAFWSWLKEQPRPPLVSEPRRVRPLRWAAAAAAVLIVSYSTVPWQGSGVGAKVERYTAGRAERRVIQLVDGSTVTLGAGSTLSVAFTPNTRRLALTGGEALFDVAHDHSRPFVVQTPYGAVTAVGTSFDVAVLRDAADVAVVEGTVRVTVALHTQGDSEPLAKLARKGERLAFGRIDHNGTRMGFISQAERIDPIDAAAWTRGQLIFHGEPLVEVIDTVNRYAITPADELRLTNPNAARIPVFGIVDQGDTGAVRDLLTNPNVVENVKR